MLEESLKVSIVELFFKMNFTKSWDEKHRHSRGRTIVKVV